MLIEENLRNGVRSSKYEDVGGNVMHQPIIDSIFTYSQHPKP